MSKTYEITSKQISNIHNGMCEIRFLISHFEEMFKEECHLNQKLKRAFEYIEPVRKDLMDKKDADMDKIMEMARRIAELNDLHSTVWSIYDMESFSDPSPVPVGSTLISEYGGDDNSVIVKGSTWLDLWIATNELVKKNPDAHGDHVYIERYKQSLVGDNLYYVFLGS